MEDSIEQRTGNKERKLRENMKKVEEIIMRTWKQRKEWKKENNSVKKNKGEKEKRKGER